MTTLRYVPMGNFEFIDDKLFAFAESLNAVLTKDRPGYPVELQTFEERRIDWCDENIRKAIIIQPNFGENGVDSSLWNFLNVAWFDDGTSVIMSTWIKSIFQQVSFALIEKNIDQLLCDSAQNLQAIGMDDLEKRNGY